MATTLTLMAGPLAALSVIMFTTGLALVRRPNRLARSLSAYGTSEDVERRSRHVQRIRIAVRRTLPHLRTAWRAALSTLPVLERRVHGLAPWLERQLIYADIDMTPREVALTALGIMVAGVAVGFLLWATMLMGLAMATGGVAVLAAYIRFKQSRRMHLFGEQLPEVLSLLIISLRAGFSTMQALDTISRQVRAPAAQEIGTVVRETHFGVPVDEALGRLAQRVRNDDMQLLVNAIIIHRETGGNLITMVETIEETVRERVKIRGEVRTLTAQASFGSWVLTGLPIVLGGFLLLINRSGMSFFWTNWIGAALGGVAVFNVLTGNMILRRITNIEL